VRKLLRYFWPRTVLLFYMGEKKIEAAFGYIEDQNQVVIEERRTIPIERESEFIQWCAEVQEVYPQTYVTTMLDTMNQGALPLCSQDVLQRFSVEAELVQSLCIDNSWLAYTSTIEKRWFEKRCKDIPIDLLYSPFVLLYQKSRPLFEERPGLFIFHRKGVLFLSVFSQDRLWYSQMILIASSEHEMEEPVLEEDETLDELDFDLEALEDDVRPISDVDILDDFSSDDEEQDTEALERIEYTLNLFEEIKAAIHKFYNDDRYDHEFIEKVTIFDMDDIAQDLVRYIKDELFMEANLYTFDPIEVMTELVVEEVGK